MSSLNISITVAAMISAAVIGNLLMKVGASAARPDWLLGLAAWESVAGLSLFALAALCYMLVLKVVPLSVAQCLMAGQFVGVVLGAAVILAEPISPMRWVGIIMIAMGIAVVGLSVDGGRP